MNASAGSTTGPALPEVPSAEPGSGDQRHPGRAGRLGRTTGPRSGAWTYRLLGAGVALGAGAAVLLLRQAGVLRGPLALAAALALVLLVPTSRNLSRRVLLAGCLFFGWVPVLWWWQLPAGSPGRISWLLALTAAALGGWLFGAPDMTGRLRRLVPRLRAADALPLLSAAAGAWLMQPWLTVRSGSAALAMSLGGWDNVAHFGMFFMIRSHGAVTSSLPTSPDGSTWAYSTYPQGFHAGAVALTELMVSPRAGGPAPELTAYVHAVGLTTVAIAVLLTAGICALPALHRRPLLALPAVAAVDAVFLLGPGARSLAFGHTNFVLASALVVASALVALTVPRVMSPLLLAALGGTLVGIAHNWVMLLTLAVPAVAIAAFPLRRARWRGSRAAVVGSALVVLATAAAVLQAAVVLASLQATSVLTLAGGIVPPSLGLVVTAGTAAAAACLIAVAQGRRAGSTGLRVGWLAASPLAGLATMAALGWYQLGSGKGLSYFFWKYGMAVVLAGLALTAVAGALAAAGSAMTTPNGRSRRPAGYAGAVLLALGLTQVFGYAGPRLHTAGVTTSPGTALNQDLRSAQTRQAATATMLLNAAAVQAAHPGGRAQFLPIGREDVLGIPLTELWFRSLSGTWTSRYADTEIPLPREVATPAAAAAMVTAYLRLDRGRLIVVSPGELRPVQALVPADLRDRVLSWGPAGS